MRHTVRLRIFRPLPGISLILRYIILCCIVFFAPQSTRAQYNCGVYGGGSYGEACSENQQPQPTDPGDTAQPEDMHSANDSDLSNTGEGKNLYLILGAGGITIGLLLFIITLRQSRRAKKG